MLARKSKRKSTRTYLIVDGKFKRMPDGKEICLCNTKGGKAEYRHRTVLMAARQKYNCAICQRSLWTVQDTFDHEAGRGAGKRDDRIIVNGKWQNAALCLSCNTRKGSKRYAWMNGIYQPVEKAA